MKISVSWREVEVWTKMISVGVGTPDVIMPVVRGGLVPGVLLSHILKVPHVVPLVYQTRDLDVEPEFSPLIELLNNDKRILIVEDIVDTGHTMLAIQNLVTFYKPKANVTCCALVKRKETQCSVVAGCQLSGFSWITFPWE
jgi:hypoxanthine phosphoribosyltransferase